MAESVSESGKLIAVVQIFRHGHRTPIFHYPKDPYGEEAYWPLEDGTLTKKGKQQEYDLGRFTRERYKHFLPREQPLKNFRVYTTDKERCIMSAQLYAAGLYPPTEDEIWNENLPWVPVPTYMAEEYLFRSDIRKISPVYAREFEKAMNEHMEKFKNDPISEMISHNSGIELKNYLDFGYLYDTLAVEDSLGLKLPEWVNGIYPDYMRNFHLDFLETVAKTDVMKRLYVGPLLYEVIKHFEKMSQTPSAGPKLIAFSGHDVNIAGILDTFGALERHLPAYASSLFIELKENNGEYFVNVFYKQEDVLPIRIGGADFNCSFENFKALFSDYAISKEQFFEECV